MLIFKISDLNEAPFDGDGAPLRYHTGARKEYFGMSIFDRAGMVGKGMVAVFLPC
jgi:hypothetical protein